MISGFAACQNILQYFDLPGDRVTVDRGDGPVAKTALRRFSRAEMLSDGASPLEVRNLADDKPIWPALGSSSAAITGSCRHYIDRYL